MKFYDKYKSYILYLTMYAPLGAICPLIAQYLNSIGFTGAMVGTVTAVGTGTAVLGGIFWGKIYANSSQKRLVIAIMFLLSAMTSIISLLISTFMLYMLIYGLLYFSQGPAHGLCDSMMLDVGENFAAVRAMGAIGYATSVFIGGQLAEQFGLRIIFYIHAAFFVVSIFVVKTLEEPPNYVSKNETNAKKATLSELFKNKGFVKLLISMFFVLGVIMANNTYFGFLYIEGGGDIGGVGLAFLLMAGSEAPFMLIIPKLNQKIPTEKLIVIGMAVAVFRFSFYSFLPSAGWLLGTFFLQGILDGIILVEMVKYFGKIVEPRLSSLSVATLYSLGNSLSAIVCNLVGGIALDIAGIRLTYIFFAAVCAVSLILYLALGLHREGEL